MEVDQLKYIIYKLNKLGTLTIADARGVKIEAFVIFLGVGEQNECRQLD